MLVLLLFCPALPRKYMENERKMRGGNQLAERGKL